MSGPKYRYDVSAKHRHDKKLIEQRMHEIEIEQPENFPFDKEWCRLREELRIANMHIDSYERARERGAKF